MSVENLIERILKEKWGLNKSQSELVRTRITSMEILSLYNMVNVLFPHNPELANKWFTSRNKAFNNKSPVELIMEESKCGYLKIKQYLTRMLGS